MKILTKLPIFFLKKSIKLGKKKKGRLTPIKVMTKRGFLTTVYVATEERPKEQKLTSEQNKLLMQFLPLGHKISGIYFRKYQGKLNYDDLYSTAIQGLITGIVKLTPERAKNIRKTKKHLSAYINKYIQEAISTELESIGIVRKFDYSENTYVTIGRIDSLEQKLYNDPDSNRLEDIIVDDTLSPDKILENEQVEDEELVNEKLIYLNKLKKILKENEYNALYLTTVDELSLSEAAKRLHMSAVGVLKAVRRAKDKIKKNIKYLKYLKKIQIPRENPSDTRSLIKIISNSISKDKKYTSTIENLLNTYVIKSDVGGKVKYFYDRNNSLKIIYINTDDNSFIWLVDKL